jgi:hypothetical protein
VWPVALQSSLRNKNQSFTLWSLACGLIYPESVVKPSRFEWFWARQSTVSALLVIIVVGALGFALDLLLVKEGVPRKDMLLVSNGLTGVAAGWLFYQLAENHKNKQQIIQERMRTIAELNHHIRNALQVIKYAGGLKTSLDASQLQLINDSVKRIEWALREVLPKYPHGFPAEAAEDNSEFSSNVVSQFLNQHKHSKPH